MQNILTCLNLWVNGGLLCVKVVRKFSPIGRETSAGQKKGGKKVFLKAEANYKFTVDLFKMLKVTIATQHQLNHRPSLQRVHVAPLRAGGHVQRSRSQTDAGGGGHGARANGHWEDGIPTRHASE